MARSKRSRRRNPQGKTSAPLHHRGGRETKRRRSRVTPMGLKPYERMAHSYSGYVVDDISEEVILQAKKARERLPRTLVASARKIAERFIAEWESVAPELKFSRRLEIAERLVRTAFVDYGPRKQQSLTSGIEKAKQAIRSAQFAA